MNADGSNQTNLTTRVSLTSIGAWLPEYPDWSADGAKIVFEASDKASMKSNIYVMNADGSGQTRLTNVPGGEWDYHYSPDWSPDGSKIAFQFSTDEILNSGSSNWEIYVINADGTGQANLTNDPSSDEHPAWSPDGAKIAFMSRRDGNGEIYVMNSDGSGQTNLTNYPGSPGSGISGYDETPTWSPDGAKIAFTSMRDGDREIYVMNADGSGQTRLTNNPAEDSQPAWSPDGSKIAFTSYRDGYHEIYVMNTDGSGQVNITNNPQFDNAASWKP